METQLSPWPGYFPVVLRKPTLSQVLEKIANDEINPHPFLQVEMKELQYIVRHISEIICISNKSRTLWGKIISPLACFQAKFGRPEKSE